MSVDRTTTDVFDDLTRDAANVTSRRRALKLIGASVAGGFMVLRGAAPASAQPRCRRVGEKCGQSKPCCSGTCCDGVCCADGQICLNGRCAAPPPPGGPNRQICICVDNTQLETCATLDCASSAEQDAICGPLCANHGGEAATGCIPGDPLCVA